MRVVLTVAAAAALWATALAADYGFRVREARLLRQSDAYTLTAEIDYRFSPPVIDALNHGLPVVLTVTTRIRQPHDWLWDTTRWRRTLNFRIQYYPLAKVYRVIDETNRFQRSFAELSAALRALGDLQDIALPVAEEWRLTGSEHYAEVAVDLNIERLPWALRVPAYFSPQWRLHAPKYRWQLND
ncbi:MAG: DUF4390 domain-containing protein [Methylohalobius sp. ZOD2]